MSFNGRDFTATWDSTLLTGVRTRTFTQNNEYIDVTTDDESGWRTLLADPATRSVEVTVGGITKDEALIADINAANIATATLQMALPSSLTTPGNLSGSFLISSFEYNAEHDGAFEFSVTFMSTGAITYVASSS